MKLLRNVVLRILEVAGQPLHKTKLVKLVYLVDRELTRRGRRPLCRWRLWLYGPFSKELLDVLDWLEARGDVEKRVEVRDLVVTVTYRAVRGADPLSPTLEDVVRSVVAEWADAPLDKLLEHVYNLPEVRAAAFGEEIKWRQYPAAWGLLASLTYEGEDVYGLDRLKMELLQHLLESGAEEVEEVKRRIGEFLEKSDIAAELQSNVEKIFAANVESLDEYVATLFERLEFLKSRETATDALLDLLIVYKLLLRYPDLRPAYLPDAVACEYLLHVAVQRQREDLVEKTRDVIPAVKQKLIKHLEELDSEWYPT